jgi:hypothetical protein
MDINQLKQEIFRKIDETDNVEVLKRIAMIIEVHNKSTHVLNETPAVYGNVIIDEKIVAYTVDGEPLTEMNYKRDIQKIVDDEKPSIPQKQVKSTMDKWVQDRLNGIL